jgi:hypothetical protein
MSTTPDLSFLPLVAGLITLIGWDGFSYVGDDGRTYWSGAETPTAEDAADCLATPRTLPAPATPLVQSARVVLARLTPAEKAALRACTVPAIQDAYDVALITGVISEADPEFASFIGGLDALGIIASSRWAALLAP